MDIPCKKKGELQCSQKNSIVKDFYKNSVEQKKRWLLLVIIIRRPKFGLSILKVKNATDNLWNWKDISFIEILEAFNKLHYDQYLKEIKIMKAKTISNLLLNAHYIHVSIQLSWDSILYFNENCFHVSQAKHNLETRHRTRKKLKKERNRQNFWERRRNCFKQKKKRGEHDCKVRNSKSVHD